MVYGAAAERPRDANGRVWFQRAGGTRIGLQETSAGQPPAIVHYALKVAPFDRRGLELRLKEVGSTVLTSADEPDVVRFAYNNGIIVEVRAQ